jgi:hypothetical protein
VSTKTDIIAIPGYHTIILDTPVTLAIGQKFSVVLKLQTPGYNWPIAVEYPYSGFSSKATAAPGQSYLSPDGSPSSWTDITYWATTYPEYGNTNVCIKAFTGTPATPDTTPPTVSISYPPSGTNYSRSDNIMMNEPKSATSNWKTQYYITVTSTQGAPTASAWVDQGSNYATSVTSPVGLVSDDHQYVCDMLYSSTAEDQVFEIHC